MLSLSLSLLPKSQNKQKNFKHSHQLSQTIIWVLGEKKSFVFSNPRWWKFYDTKFSFYFIIFSNSKRLYLTCKSIDWIGNGNWNITFNSEMNRNAVFGEVTIESFMYKQWSTFNLEIGLEALDAAFGLWRRAIECLWANCKQIFGYLSSVWQ